MSQRAFNALDLLGDKQAYPLSYLDTFRLVDVFFLFTLPLLRTREKSATETALAARAASEAH